MNEIIKIIEKKRIEDKSKIKKYSSKEELKKEEIYYNLKRFLMWKIYMS